MTSQSDDKGYFSHGARRVKTCFCLYRNDRRKIMGCTESKVKSTPEEINTRRQKIIAVVRQWRRPSQPKELKTSVTWTNPSSLFKRRKGTVTPMQFSVEERTSVFGTNTPPPSRNSIQERDMMLEDIEDDASLVNFCVSPKNADDLDLETGRYSRPLSLIPVHSTPGLETIRDENTSRLSKSSMNSDLELEDVEEYSDQSDGEDRCATRCLGTISPRPYKRPVIVHDAWSDNAVPTKAADKHNPVRFASSVDKNHGTNGVNSIGKRNRPKAAKGIRQAPDITDVYEAELALPGTPLPDPKRQQEKLCLDAWMARRLEDGGK